MNRCSISSYKAVKCRKDSVFMCTIYLTALCGTMCSGDASLLFAVDGIHVSRIEYFVFLAVKRISFYNFAVFSHFIAVCVYAEPWILSICLSTNHMVKCTHMQQPGRNQRNSFQHYDCLPSALGRNFADILVQFFFHFGRKLWNTNLKSNVAFWYA